MKTKKLLFLALLFPLFFGSKILAQPSAVRLGSGAVISNTIIYKNAQLHPLSGVFQVEHSASDSVLSGSNNVQLNGSPFTNGYRVNSSSPVYNRGTLAGLRVQDSLDLDYQKRVNCEKVDMGAYEFEIVTTKITVQPQGGRVCEGSPKLLTASAVGTNVTYQWQRNGVDLIGKTSATLSLLGAITDTGAYRVIAYGDCCNDTSISVRLDVDLQPHVIAMRDTSVVSSSDVALHVISATGTVHWLESDFLTVVLDTMLRNLTETRQYIAVATNGVCTTQATATVTITVEGSPCIVHTLQDTTICSGDPYRLLVLPSTTVDYKWHVLGTNIEFPKYTVVRPTDSMVFVAFGQNELGTVCSDTLRLHVRTVAFTVMPDKSVCGTSSVQLTSEPQADDWYNSVGNRLGSGNIFVTPQTNATNVYTAKLSDGVCTVSATVKVYANPPSLRALPADTTICIGEGVFLQTNIDPSFVIWKRENGDVLSVDLVVYPDQTETYYAWAYDDLCGDISVSTRIVVEPKPEFRAFPQPAVCQFSQVYLSSVPNASYWTRLNGTRLMNPITAFSDDSYVGVYHWGACTVKDTVEVLVELRPSFVAMPDTSIQKGDSVVLWSTPEASSWSVLQTGSVLSSLRVAPQDTTAYVASLQTALCGTFFDTVYIHVMSLDTFYVTLCYYTGCFDGEGWATVSVVGGSGQYTYLWSHGVTDSIAEGLSAGHYSVTVTNMHGKEVVTSFTMPIVAPLLVDIQTFEPKNERCDGGKIFTTVSGGTEPYRYLWSNGAIGKDLLNIESGLYSLTVTDSRGCEFDQEVRLTCLYKRVMPTLFITPNGDGLNDYLDIKYIERYPKNTVIIINAYGEEIIRKKNYDNVNVFWDGRNKRGERIPDGVYYYIIESEGMDNMVGWLLMKLSKSN